MCFVYGMKSGIQKFAVFLGARILDGDQQGIIGELVAHTSAAGLEFPLVSIDGCRAELAKDENSLGFRLFLAPQGICGVSCGAVGDDVVFLGFISYCFFQICVEEVFVVDICPCRIHEGMINSFCHGVCSITLPFEDYI